MRLLPSPFSLRHPQPPTHPPTHSSTSPTLWPPLNPPSPPPILLVSLDMLPSPLPTHFSAPLHFGHSYIYGVIRCSSPSKASRVTAHTELWWAEGGLGYGGREQGESRRGGVVGWKSEGKGIFKWGMKRQLENGRPVVEWFPKNERKMIRERSRDWIWTIQEQFICPSVCVNVPYIGTPMCVAMCVCGWALFEMSPVI